MKRTSFFVLFCFFGAVICADPPQCTSDEYDDHVSVFYGSKDNSIAYEKDARPYRDGVFCLARDLDGFVRHLGACFEGTCKEEPRDAQGNLPGQWAEEYHQCPSIVSLSKPVKKCTFFCKKKTEEHLPEGYFFGIYRHPSLCELGDDKIGVCASGQCQDPKRYPQIDDNELKPPSK
ncbi:secreted salivary gland peptide, putative [Ixodes scapularis]|uniref:Secreted salivary gland peptide, putative n=1 Tax=Ixodes scapularis TaxID=6945 RepID=B7QJJ8_IXOSC|nr:secreted salivary gland peptide, putative [Ixodes scapularis]|eukprot:XP_002415355.1 secreted salivary gland peptide, putative [Ixodes scapularis]